MSHGRHIYSKASDTSQAIICEYPQSEHVLPHWKFLLRCCSDCPCIHLPDQETDNQNSDTTPSIRFQIYHCIGRCTDHGRIPLKDQNKCYMCKK